MQLERIAIRLRARPPWEAVDLGCRMAMHWARPIWRLWFVLFVPIAAGLVVLQPSPWLAALLLWWLLPLLDGFLIHLLGHAVFGSMPPLAQSLGSWRAVLSASWTSLLLRPFAWRRGVSIAVRQLEGSRGAAARRRVDLLTQRIGGHLLGLGLVCVLFVLAIVVAGSIAGELFEPGGEFAADDSDGGSDGFWSWSRVGWIAVGFCLVEPLYVAGSFALYLNRRVQLEGWDIELGLRRIAARVAERAVPFSAGTAVVLALLIAALPQPAMASPDVVEPTPAAESTAADIGATPVSASSCNIEPEPHETESYAPLPTPARAAIERIIADPAFGATREVETWKARERDQPKSDADFEWLLAFGDAIASVLRVVAWIALVVVVLVVIRLIARRWQRDASDTDSDTQPAVMFGLSIAPASLPDDVAAAARALLDAGNVRDALALLYRGALSELVHRRGLRVGAGATEGDVLRLARRQLPADVGYFERLLPTWIALAYGHRMPDSASVLEFCDAYRRQFGSALAS